MNILDLIAKQGITPKRASSAKGGEYGSPCPKCGGEDRFRIWPAQGEHGTYWCRQCDIGGDAVSYLREIEGRSCPDAHGDLGIECASATCPVLDKCRKGHGRAPRREESPKQTPQTPDAGPQWMPCAATAPSEQWSGNAGRLVQWAHNRLLQEPAQLAYLQKRGLPLEAVQRYRLGWWPETKFRPLSEWGLPEEKNDATGRPRRVWIPRGIVIPTFHGEAVERVRIRRHSDDLSDGRGKYIALKGCGDEISVLGADRRAFVVVESDLDGLLIDWITGDLVGAVPLTSCSVKPRSRAFGILQNALALLVALDFEPRVNEKTGRHENPGGQSALWWQRTFPQAERWPVPVGKDPGEALEQGVDLRQWILEGLPPGLRVQAAKPAPAPEPETLNLKPDTSEAAPAEAGVIKGKSKNGYLYFIAEGPAQAARLRELYPEEAESFILVKRISPEAEILETRPIAETAESEPPTYDPSRQRRARQ